MRALRGCKYWQHLLVTAVEQPQMSSDELWRHWKRSGRVTSHVEPDDPEADMGSMSEGAARVTSKSTKQSPATGLHTDAVMDPHVQYV